ncbi:hypothetical protein L3Y34_002515 [Caenorhabditis briggsae]|uniref:Uncharacterized protein n=1 Tax=Caenorhabditis briggsae TaxID=6238 RepID=A0AAE9IS55_CAEBR|nr:hypothetical protein L3Y34_002515 [Caenorhabditis briggsae]
METKEYHIGKTVPEMIATLEKYDNECRWAVSKAVLPEIIRIASEAHFRYVEMTNDSRIANYDETGEYLQVVLRPFPNYEDMPNEELIKRYNHSSHWVF